MTKELIEKRSNAAKYMRDLQNKITSEKRQMTAEEETKYNNCLEEINQIDAQDKREKEIADVEARGKSYEELEKRELTTPPAEHQKEEKRDYQKEFRNFLKYGDIPADSMVVLPEERAMSSGTGSTGGYMIPEIFSDMLFEYAKNDSAIRALATVQQWKGDGAFPVVTAFGTSYLVAEGSAVTTTTPTLAQKTISGYQFMYNVDVPIKLINNSAYNLESALMGWWAKSDSNLEEGYFATGTGSSQPLGLTAAATTGTDTAANSAIAADDVVNWYYKLAQTYRRNASWIFADLTIARIRKIVNAVTTSGATMYVWVPGLGGEPDTLMGRPIYESAGMPAFAAGAKVGVFGDISQYQIVEFGQPSMIRDPYTLAKYGQVSYIGHRLMDTALPVVEAIVTCPIKS